MDGKDRGWVCSAPEATRVRVANARYFEDGVPHLGIQKVEHKALDLTRYRRK